MTISNYDHSTGRSYTEQPINNHSGVHAGLSMEEQRDYLIANYFTEGHRYSLIICYLCYIHGISISLRQLKRILKRLNLSRRSSVSAQTITRTAALMRVS